jgi:hypothetical protein
MHTSIISLLIGVLGSLFVFAGITVAQDSRVSELQSTTNTQQSLQSNAPTDTQLPTDSFTDQMTTEDIQLEQEININSYLSDTVKNQPQTQQQLIEQIDVFLDIQFQGKLFNESKSVGDLKMVIQDRFITPKKEINFLVFEQHIDTSFDFDEAEYTWTVKKGFNEIFSYTEKNKNTFFYNFAEDGSYGVDVVARFPDGRELRSLMTFAVLKPVSIDYQPFDIGAGDEITISAEREIPNSMYRWVVDGEEVNSSDSKFTFREYKGQGAVYEVKLYIRNQNTNTLTHAGEIKIEVGKPEAWIYLTDLNNGVELEYADAVRINQESTIRIQVEPRGFGSDSLEYIFRVNGESKQSESATVDLQVRPDQEYQVEVLVRNSDGSKFSARKFVINQVTAQDQLQANAKKYWDEMQERYISLGIFFSILGLSLVWVRVANT